MPSRVGLPDNGAHILPVEPFITFPALDIFQVAADGPLGEEALPLFAGDGLVPDQLLHPPRIDFPFFGHAEGLLEIREIAEGGHVLDAVSANVLDEAIALELRRDKIGRA